MLGLFGSARGLKSAALTGLWSRPAGTSEPTIVAAARFRRTWGRWTNRRPAAADEFDALSGG